MRSPLVFLVSCVAAKTPSPAQARELYISDWFIKARRYVEATGAPWYILSAKYGLVTPSQLIAPYDLTLRSLSRDERWTWGGDVLERFLALEGEKGEGREVRILAGALYRGELATFLEVRGYRVIAPLSRMGIGHQKQWLRENTPQLGEKEKAR